MKTALGSTDGKDILEEAVWVVTSDHPPHTNAVSLSTCCLYDFAPNTFECVCVCANSTT